MSQAVNVNFKLDADVKKSMEQACSELGLSMSAAFTVFAKLDRGGLMRLLWEDRAWSDYLYWQTQDKKTLKRINGLIKDIQRSTFEGIGKPEPLKENLSGMWSRRIDDTNRIVYYEKDEIIYIVSCKGHYED